MPTTSDRDARSGTKAVGSIRQNYSRIEINRFHTFRNRAVWYHCCPCSTSSPGSRGGQSRDRGPLASRPLPLVLESDLSETASRKKKLSGKVRDLIFQMGAEDPTWGAPRIYGELLVLGVSLSQNELPVPKENSVRPGADVIPQANRKFQAVRGLGSVG
jgi:hypothetical protein